MTKTKEIKIRMTEDQHSQLTAIADMLGTALAPMILRAAIEKLLGDSQGTLRGMSDMHTEDVSDSLTSRVQGLETRVKSLEEQLTSVKVSAAAPKGTLEGTPEVATKADVIARYGLSKKGYSREVLNVARDNGYWLAPDGHKWLLVEGQSSHHWTLEGTPEGTPDATPEGTVEETPKGTLEGTVEETPEGTVEETPEGTPEWDSELVNRAEDLMKQAKDLLASPPHGDRTVKADTLFSEISKLIDETKKTAQLFSLEAFRELYPAYSDRDIKKLIRLDGAFTTDDGLRWHSFRAIRSEVDEMAQTIPAKLPKETLKALGDLSFSLTARL